MKNMVHLYKGSFQTVGGDAGQFILIRLNVTKEGEPNPNDLLNPCVALLIPKCMSTSTERVSLE